MKIYPSRTGDGNKLNVEETLRERGSWLTVRAEYQLRQQAGLPAGKQHTVLLYYMTAIQYCGLSLAAPLSGSVIIMLLERIIQHHLQLRTAWVHHP